MSPENQPGNQLEEIDDQILIAISPDKKVWMLTVETLQEQKELLGMSGLEVLGALEKATSDQLDKYGIQQANLGIVGS